MKGSTIQKESIVTTLLDAGLIAIVATAGAVMAFSSRAPQTDLLGSAATAIEKTSQTLPAVQGQAEETFLSLVRTSRPAQQEPAFTEADSTTDTANKTTENEGPEVAVAPVPSQPDHASPRSPQKPEQRTSSESDAETTVRALFQVRLATDGLLPGRFHLRDAATKNFVAADRVTISFIRAGRVVTRVEPGVGGVFQTAGLEPGQYSVVANGPDGFAAFGIQVLAADETGSDELGVQVEALLVPRYFLPAFRQLVRTYVLQPREPTSRSQQGDRKPKASDGRDRVASTVSLRKSQAALRIAQSSRGVSARLVRVDPSRGNSVPVTGMTVLLFDRTRAVAQATVDDEGRFEVAGIEPGFYSLMGLGPKGLIASGIQVLPGRASVAEQDRAERTFQLVALQESDEQPSPVDEQPSPASPPDPPSLQDEGDPTSDPEMAIVQAQDFPPVFEEIQLEEEQTQEDDLLFAPGPPGMGAGGGGGGFGGGGLGLLGLLGLIGLAGDDDDDGDRRPVTPFRPRSRPRSRP